MPFRIKIWCIGVALLSSAVPARAELRFQATKTDLGQIRGGTALTHAFPFTVDGTEAVEIVEVRSGCGCLQPRLEKLTYAAGEKGTLLIDVRTLGQVGGRHDWTTHVRYRTANGVRDVSLQVSAEIINEVTVQPAALTLVAEGALGQHLTLTDTRARPLTITDVRTSSSHLQAHLASQQRSSKGHLIGKIAVAPASYCPPGRHDILVSIYTTDPVYRHLHVPVTLVKQARRAVSAQPESLVFQAPPGQPIASRMVRVGASDRQRIVIDRVTSDHPALTCSWAPGPDHYATIRVLVNRGHLDDAKLESRVRIHLRSPHPEVLTVPVSVVNEGSR